MENYYIKDVMEATGGSLLNLADNIQIQSVSTNSNEIGENCLFIPIIGERVDAHDYIDGAILNGAVATLTSRHSEALDGIPFIKVVDTTKALQAMGTAYGKKMEIPKIGITGSVGKTSTKEMIACALGAGYKVFKTHGNFNSNFGVPLTLLRMSYEDQIAVLEMGISNPGEMAELATFVDLDVAVVTNIGVSHIEQLLSQEGICREKLHIADALVASGKIFLNGDDSILMQYKKELSAKVFTYGLGEHNDYRAREIHTQDNVTTFVMDLPGGIEISGMIPMLGAHNVRNALVAVAIATLYGIAPEAALLALSGYGGVHMRQQIHVVEGVTVIDDSYNASPASMKAGIDVLSAIQVKGKRVAVLADMLELGPDSKTYHQEVGAYLRENPVTHLVLFGELAKSIGEGASTRTELQIIHFQEKEKMNEYLESLLQEGDAVLFKGSRGMKLDECVQYITKRSTEYGSNH